MLFFILNELYVVLFSVPLNSVCAHPPEFVALLFICGASIKKSTYSKLIPAFPVAVVEPYAVELDNVSWLNPNILTFFPSKYLTSPTFNVFCIPFTVTVAVSESSVIVLVFDITFAICAISSHVHILLILILVFPTFPAESLV